MVDEQDINIGAAVSEANRFKKDLNEKKADWKSKLFAAFNSEQILFSLFILTVFYTGYTITHGYFHINDGKHEDDVIDRCYCRTSHQVFYFAWFIVCCVIWLLLHSYTYVAIRFPPCGKCLKCLKPCKPKNVWRCFKKLFNCCTNRKKSQDLLIALNLILTESNTSLIYCGFNVTNCLLWGILSIMKKLI